MRRGEEMTADLQRYERRMRAQLTTVVTLPTESLANIPSLDALTDEEREQVEQVLADDGSERGDRPRRNP
jgi:hypothetical protein